MLKLNVLLLAVVLAFSAAPFATLADDAATVQQVSVNINAASVEELTQLKGIGESKAEAIVAWREEHGSFESVEQLLDVKGIGETTLAQNTDKITLE